jgi:hypothetical protein
MQQSVPGTLSPFIFIEIFSFRAVLLDCGRHRPESPIVQADRMSIEAHFISVHFDDATIKPQITYDRGHRKIGNETWTE